MQAVVLAGGLGKRLNSVMPKCLTLVSGKPILEHTLLNVYDLVDEIIIVIGYKGEEVIKYFGDNFNGVKIRYAVQKEQLGTAHALLQAEELVDDKFVMLMGDNFYFKDDIEKCIISDLSALAMEVKDPSRFGVFLLENDFITSIIEKPKEFVSNLASTGLYVLDMRIFDEIRILDKSLRGEYEIPDAVLKLAKKNKIKCEKVNGLWFPVDKREDIGIGEELLARFLKD